MGREINSHHGLKIQNSKILHYNIALHCTTQHCTTQHSKALLSSAQQCTAKHNTTHTIKFGKLDIFNDFLTNLKADRLTLEMSFRSNLSLDFDRRRKMGQIQ
jgi:hypothetical protein